MPKMNSALNSSGPLNFPEKSKLNFDDPFIGKHPSGSIK